MLLTPIVAACSIGLITIVYNYVERGRSRSAHSMVLTVNGGDYQIDGITKNEGDIFAWAIKFCGDHGKR